MRICLEFYALYCAILCTILTGILALGLSDSAVDWVAQKTVNISYLVFGPILFTWCLYGFWNIKPLIRVCTPHGIVPGET